MGFIDPSSIYIDAVLTDEGRARLARNDGTFAVVRFRLADDEIDYRFFNQLTGSDSKDRKILDTPVLEAPTYSFSSLRYPLISIRSSRLQYLPTMVAKPTSIALKEQTDSIGGGVDVTVSQQIARAQTILPAEIIDFNYIIEVDNDLLFVSNEIPTTIEPSNIARYIITAVPNQLTSASGTQCKFNVRVQTLTTDIFDIMVGATVAKPRTISTQIRVTGQTSGMSALIPTTITEFATS